MRLSATDWVDGRLGPRADVEFAQALEARGCAAIHVSSGGLSPAQKIPIGPGYQVPLARAVKARRALPTIAVGLITELEQAEAIVAPATPTWSPSRAPSSTTRAGPGTPRPAGASVGAPPQYLRSQPRGLPHLFDGAAFGGR